MDRKITSIISHMADSHVEMARILEAERFVVESMSHLIRSIPDEHIPLGDIQQVTANSLEVTKSLTSYISSIAELEEAIAENLTYVMKEIDPKDEGE